MALLSPRGAAEVAAALAMTPHPEGGWYRRWWESDREQAASPGSLRAVSSILYLLAAGGQSKLHTIKSDELWFHHSGDGLLVVEVDKESGAFSETLLTGDMAAVAAGAGTFNKGVRGLKSVFGAYCPSGGPHGYCLVSCAVAPEFRFEDWALAPQDSTLALVRGSAEHAAASDAQRAHQIATVMMLT